MTTATCNHCKQRVPLRQDKTMVPHKAKLKANPGNYNFKTRTATCPGSDTTQHQGEKS